MLGMFDIELAIDAPVQAVDGVCGHVICVIIDPIQEKVTHLVVEEAESPCARRLVPIELVHSARRNEIEIKCSLDKFRDLDMFVDGEFLPSRAHPRSHRLWPYVEPEDPAVLAEHEKVPAGEVAIRRGMPVQAIDGVIGQVDELIVNRKDRSITHLVLREGHLWGQKDISIPVSQISGMIRNEVYLRLTKKEIEKLPEIRIRRFNR